MPKRTAIRTCIACGVSAEKHGFLRAVRSPEGVVAFDVKGNAPGRGAYLCAKQECFDKARKKRLLDSKLRVRLSADDYNSLEDVFKALCGKDAGAFSKEGE